MISTCDVLSAASPASKNGSCFDSLVKSAPYPASSRRFGSSCACTRVLIMVLNFIFSLFKPRALRRSISASAIDADHRPGGIAAVIAGEIKRGRDNFVGFTIARYRRLQIGFLVL